jgi:hypothetical protein
MSTKPTIPTPPPAPLSQQQQEVADFNCRDEDARSRGMGECRASKWVSDPPALARLMTSVACRGGTTQIGKVLAHARAEGGKRKVNALVYVGDCMEENVRNCCAEPMSKRQ